MTPSGQGWNAAKASLAKAKMIAKTFKINIQGHARVSNQDTAVVA